MGALVVLACLALTGAALAVSPWGSEETEAGVTDSARATGTSREARQAPQLPNGGRRIFPRYRVVAFYGAPQSEELGVLGIGTPAAAARRLHEQSKPYRSGGRAVLPAFELLAAIAAGSPGADGKYRTRQSGDVIRRYLKAARRANALLVLDVQPGRADFLTEVKALERYLEEPDVGLALDPEWHMEQGETPGDEIGSTDAATVNRVSTYLSEIVRRKNLPQKLLIVHQFTDDMIRNKTDLEPRRGVALVLNADGFGTQASKISKYAHFTRGRRGFYHGLKLFYEEDVDLMQPSEVLALRPPPDVVIYE